jgi:hypothetical protein
MGVLFLYMNLESLFRTIPQRKTNPKICVVPLKVSIFDTRSGKLLSTREETVRRLWYQEGRELVDRLSREADVSFEQAVVEFETQLVNSQLQELTNNQHPELQVELILQGAITWEDAEK